MKKLFTVLLITMLILVLVACGGENTTETTVETPTTEAPTTEAPTTEAPTTEAPTTEELTTEEPTTEEPTTEAAVAQPFNVDEIPGVREISLGKTVAIEGLVKFTLEETYLAEELHPSNPGFAHSYLEKREGNTYVITKGTIVNMGYEEIDFKSFTYGDPVATMYCVNGLGYSGIWVAENKEGSTITSKISPWEERDFYIVTIVPNNMIGSVDEVENLVFGFKDFKEDVISFFGEITWDACTYVYSVK